ncbi:unnamed protein product [Caenorhabditis angaria]|uniref:Fatty acyl-CoA reductase n=1 Tax=Caenorhabditis angaria TaxID=860376 RepID=A0A9P1J754_9PELO|nr:unnamed protein product [Caenorhabditis angaria]
MTFQVREVFSGRSVLLTGATGFLGKVIVEKLLWTIDDIERIYVIIRDQKGKKAQERLVHMLNDPLFGRLHENKPHQFEKIIPISGDMMEENLGIQPHDLKAICDEVSIVIHSAATVKFDEHLRTAVNMNVTGTTRMIALCHKINKLVSFVHVSTAYANCDRFETAEEIYTPPVAPQKLMDALTWMDDEDLSKITPKLLGARPNTYTLTKALAETQMEVDSSGLPVIIIRPSIVGAMWGGPLPGWTDNINGPTGIFTAVGKGVLTNMCGSVESKADIIPVDVVANMIIVAAGYRASESFDHIPIIHCSSGELNPLYWETVVIFLEQFYKKYPMLECYGVPSTQFHQSRKWFLVNYYLKHQIPAKILDVIYGLIGKKQTNVRLYGKIWKMIEALHFFTTRGWQFNAKGLPQLITKMSTEDKNTYNFDIRTLNWESYLFDYVMGIKKYILKEKIDNVHNARRNLNRLRIQRGLFAALGYYLAIRVVGRKWKTQTKWLTWIAAMVSSYTYAEVNFRRPVNLKSLEEYKRTSDYRQYV